MGLDSVEMILEVEEHFGVVISDEEAGAIRTVGDLAELLQERVARREEAGCLSLPWFLKLRRLVREAIDDPSWRVRPSQRVVDRLNKQERRKLWRRLNELLGSEPRDLERPNWMSSTIVLTSVAAFLASVCLAVLEHRFAWPALLGLAPGIWLLLVLTRPFRQHPPFGYRTFGEITLRLVGRESVAAGFPVGDRDLLFHELVSIIVEQLGVDADEVTRKARFVEDLNMD